MPFRDRTGPEGQGPMTGWGMGRCRGYASSMRQNRRFMCRWPFKKVSQEEEKDMLKEEAEAIKEDLADIEKRLSEIEKK